MGKRANYYAWAVLLFSLISAQALAATATRTSAFVYDPVSGLLIKEIIEPNDPNLCVVTLYDYDDFGNKASATTRNCDGSAGEAAAPAPGSDAVFVSRAETVTYTYNTDGSATAVATNALGHTETKNFEAAFGNVLDLTGPNGLPTSWTYDTFGRKTKEIRADATTTTWMYNQPCDLGNGNLTNAAYCIATNSTGTSRWTRTYFDELNRELATTRIDFTNSLWIDEGRIDYDTMGRVDKRYLPHIQGNFASAKFATFTYDLLGRVLTETAPDGIDRKEVAYSGLQTTVTRKALDGSIGEQTQITVKNSQRQTVSITDANNKTLTYQYDPFGNLVKTTDALGNVTTLYYDTRSRKTSMVDPDMGTWTYFYNALGELIRQIDANAKTTSMLYDKLGRMTSRTEFDLISTWTYDTATKGIGKLHTATSDNGYSRTHTYDPLGRPETTTTVFNNEPPMTTSVTYDSAGRVNTQTYPTGFAVKNVYNTVNYLIEVRHATTDALYWKADTMDEANRLTQQTYDNGVVTQEVFDPATGRLTRQIAGTGNSVQDMSYEYDSLGNLQIRTDANNNLVETFAYDNLNRITIATAISSTVSTASIFDYDAIGNIVNKSDVGAYTYNATLPGGRILPHAVGTITGTVNGVVNPAYRYDNNGNMTGFGDIATGPGREILWTSFNMPSQITNCVGGTCKTAEFLYSPEHERTRELQADHSIVYTLSPRYDTGLHFEKKYIAVNNALTGAIEYEHYLYAGGLMFGKYITETATDGSTIVSTKTEYYSKDHLGSIVAITDQQGNIATDGSGQSARYSYDAWGKRRMPDGSANPPGNPDMYHGFTGHEMLDDVGLIHMNGRLYDPVLARFVSADPTIQDPLNLLSYNRYSYVWNNPLAANDPSGFEMSCMYAANEICGGDAPPTLPEVPVIAPPWPEEDVGGGTFNGFVEEDVGGGTFNGFVPVDDNSFSDRNYLGQTWSNAGSTSSVFDWSNSVNSAQQSMADWAVQHPGAAYIFLAGIAATEAFVPASIVEVIPFGKVVGKAGKLVAKELPAALRGGEATVHVYQGVKDGKAVYAGITNNLVARQAAHGERFVLDPLTKSAVTRGEARAIEQALIVENSGFQNIRNSISPNHSYYQDAVDWGKQWLRSNGY